MGGRGPVVEGALMKRRMVAMAMAMAAGALLSVPAVPAVPAAAATLQVNDVGDAADANPGNGVCATAGGVCTLRAAVQEANALAGSDTITVPAGKITLGSVLTITSNLTVTGAGARASIVSGTPGHGLFTVTAGTVTFNDLSMQDTSVGTGAALYANAGVVSLNRVRIHNITTTGTSTSRGAVNTWAANLTITDSEISANTTTTASFSAYGGGLAAESNSSVTIRNSTIAGNSVATNDTSYTATGGGVYVDLSSSAEIVSSTLTGNSATAAIASSGRGGNLYHRSGGAGTVLVRNSILAGGKDSYGGADDGNCSAFVPEMKQPTFAGANLVSDTTCGTVGAAPLIGNAKLTAVADRGGPTDTAAPAADSPALNAAADCATAADQRGQGRPIGPACDLGAVELGADVGSGTTVSNSSPVAGSDIVATSTITNNGADDATAVSTTITAAGAAAIVSPPAGCSVSGVTVSCATADLPRAQTVTLLTVVKAPQSGTVTATTAVAAAQPDPNPQNNSSQAAATVPAAAGPGPGPGTSASPAPTQPPAVRKTTVTAKAVKGRSRLAVRVGPDLGKKKQWGFTVQRAKGKKWKKVASSRTKTAKHVRVLDLRRGKYRVVVTPAHGYSGTVSRTVRLKR